MSKKLIGFGTAAVIAGATLGASHTGIVSTQTTTTKSTKVRHGHHLRLDARLNEAVTDGTITSAQETAFKSELKTLRSERKATISKPSTADQRKAEHAKLKQELQTWATSNNFPLAKVAPKLAS